MRCAPRPRVGARLEWTGGDPLRPDVIYADALLQATLRSATEPGRGGVRARFTATLEGRRYDAAGPDLTAAASRALNGASGGGPIDWEATLPAGPGRFIVAPSVGSLESPVTEAFAQAMNEVMDGAAYRFAYTWAQVGVSLPGEVGLMAASMVPGVGETMDVHALATSDSRFERLVSGASLGLSAITLGVSPNVGRFAAFVGDTVNTAQGVKTLKALRASDDVSASAVRSSMRTASSVADAAAGSSRLGRNAVAETGGMLGRANRGPSVRTRADKCFVAGTLVKAEAGLVPIETIKVGDRVWSRDAVSGSEAWHQVVSVFESHPGELVRLGYVVVGQSRPRELIGTAEHPFWSKDREEWVSMGDLKLGERLHVNGEAAEAVVTALVFEIAPAGETFTTYNFEVAGWHTYFVAPKNSPPDAETIWVHNMCDARFTELLAKIEKAAPHHGERVLDIVRGKIPEDKFKALEAAVTGRKLAPENALFRVAKHGDMPSPRPGQNSHHGAMSAWMKKHFKGYDPDKAPAVLMPELNHQATFGVYNTWRATMRRKMGGTFDWKNVSETEMKALSEQMFDAAKVPSNVRQDYWQWFDRMKGALNR